MPVSIVWGLVPTCKAGQLLPLLLRLMAHTVPSLPRDQLPPLVRSGDTGLPGCTARSVVYRVYSPTSRRNLKQPWSCFWDPKVFGFWIKTQKGCVLMNRMRILFLPGLLWFCSAAFPKASSEIPHKSLCLPLLCFRLGMRKDKLHFMEVHKVTLIPVFSVLHNEIYHSWKGFGMCYTISCFLSKDLVLYVDFIVCGERTIFHSLAPAHQGSDSTKASALTQVSHPIDFCCE